MAKYIVLECMECKHKYIYVNGTSDGKRCDKCGSRCYFPIDGGSKSELMGRHNLLEQKEVSMRKTKIPKPTCNICGKEAPVDKDMSNGNWTVYKTKEPCECGGTFKINFDK